MGGSAGGHGGGAVAELEAIVARERQRCADLEREVRERDAELARFKTEQMHWIDASNRNLRGEKTRKEALEANVHELEEAVSRAREEASRAEARARESVKQEISGCRDEIAALQRDKVMLQREISVLRAAKSSESPTKSHGAPAAPSSSSASASFSAAQGLGFTAAEISQCDSILFVDVELGAGSTIESPARLSINDGGLGVLGPHYERAFTIWFDEGTVVENIAGDVRISHGADKCIVIVDGRKPLIAKIVKAMISMAGSK